MNASAILHYGGDAGKMRVARLFPHTELEE